MTAVAAWPRAKCSKCGRWVAVTPTGWTHQHHTNPQGNDHKKVWCWGAFVGTEMKDFERVDDAILEATLREVLVDG